MVRVGRVVLLLAVLATQGCWSQAGWGPERRAFNDLETGVTAANVGDLEVRWTASVPGATREAVVEQDRAFVVSDGRVTAFDLSSGTTSWSEDICCEPGGAAVVAGRLHVPAACSVSSFDLATGARESRYVGPESPPEGFPWSCTSAGDAVGVGTRVVVPWLYSVPPIPASPICRLGLWWHGPGVSAVDFDAPPQDWDRSDVQSGCMATLPPFPWPPSGIPPYGEASSDGTFVLVPRAQTLNAIALDCAEAQCPLAWSVDVGDTIVGPAVVLVGGDIAVATDDGQVVVVDGTTHAVEWTADVGATVAHPLAATATTIFAAATDGTVAAFPAAGCGTPTCTAGWTSTVSSPASARPSIGGDVLYVGSADGIVTAFPAAGCGEPTCTKRWTGTTPGQVTGAPAIFSGTIVVGSQDGTVTAFALPDS